MSNKVKNIVTTVVFSAFIAVFVVMCIIQAFNPKAYSDVEKRPLAQFPEISWEGIVDKTTINGFDKFAVEQFPLREFFRSIKAHFAIDILNLKENNGYAVEEGSITQITTSYNQEILDYQIGRMEYLYNTYLKDNGGDHYLTLIPDKNYYFGEQYNYPTADYEALREQLKETLSEMAYIDLFGSLKIEDYYKSDWHWDQSKLDGVISTLGEEMGFGDRISGEYSENVLENFHGGYYDQSALYPDAEQLIYLTNEILDACKVYDYETGKSYGLYNHELYTSKTPYDFFLSGTRALLRIDNPNATTDKKLIVLRDSYGASLVPLMAEGYASIYVVDIRYISPDIVTPMISSVDGMDVLFALSTTVLASKTFK